jgi:Tol biopolymer transport system component
MHKTSRLCIRRNFLFAATVSLLCPPTLALEIEELWRVSVSLDRTQAADSRSDPDGYFGLSAPSISPDGRYVAFVSESDNLVAGDTNGAPDAFVHILETGETIRVSVTSEGAEVAGPQELSGYETAVVANNGDVAFVLWSDGLVPGDNNGSVDLFVRNLAGGETERLTLRPDGTGASSQLDDAYAVGELDITPDGRYVAFASRFSDLIANDTNDVRDVFVRDRWTDETRLASVDSGGLSLGGQDPQITPDGRYVAFEGPPGLRKDIYVKDMITGELWLESINASGLIPQGAVGSLNPSISDDGRFVLFYPGTWPGDLWSPYVLRDRTLLTTTLVMDNLTSAKISGDGRFVAAGTDRLCEPDPIIVYDRTTGEMAYVSVTPDGHTGNDRSEEVSISRDGRLIAFKSHASNLVEGDTNGIPDIFVARIRDGSGRGSSLDPTDTDADGTIDECDRDDDDDGLNDPFEIEYGLDPLDAVDAELDPDGDGLTNLEEHGLGTNPLLVDSDGDSWLDNIDICPRDADANQANFDGDDRGDACDWDDDNDGYGDWEDAYPLDPSRWNDESDPTPGPGPAPDSGPSLTPPPPQNVASSGGGGGAFGPLALGLLLILGVWGRSADRRDPTSSAADRLTFAIPEA